MIATLTTAQVRVENFLLVTHAVPAVRLERYIPQGFELETFPSDRGEELSLISASTFCNRQLHWSVSRYPAIDFDQSTFRTYVTFRGRRGSYFLGTYVSTKLSFLGQSALAARSYLAEYDVVIDSDSRRGYRSYVSRAHTTHGELLMEVEATDEPGPKGPFGSGDEHSQYITYRLHGFARNPFGFQTYGPVEHRRMRPWSGRLKRGRFDFWTRLGILSEDEALGAYSVLVEPSVLFTLRTPRIAVGGSGGRADAGEAARELSSEELRA